MDQHYFLCSKLIQSLSGTPSTRSWPVSGWRTHLCLLLIETIGAKHLGHRLKRCGERQHELLILVLILSCKGNKQDVTPTHTTQSWIGIENERASPRVNQGPFMTLISSNFRIKCIHIETNFKLENGWNHLVQICSIFFHNELQYQKFIFMYIRHSGIYLFVLKWKL